MKIRNGCVLPAVVMMLAGTTGLVHAQETKPVPPSPSPSAPPPATAVLAQPSAEAPANPAAAKAVLDKARASYKALKSYQDTAKLKFEMRAKDPEGNDMNQDDSEELTFVFAGARKFVLSHNDFAVYSDGKTQTAHLEMQSQYVQRDAEDAIMDEAANGPVGVLAAVHAPANLMISPAKFEKEFPLLADATHVKAEEVGGKPGKRVSGKGELPGMPTEEKIPMTIWFADDTGLMGEVTIDLKPTYAAMMGPEAKLEKAQATITFSDIQINSDVPAEKYTFKASETDKKVKSFDPQQELVGAPTPDFKGVDLEGKPIAISDFKGKVVLLDFWATWCGPCIQAIPKIQELSAEYADKGVVVIGMNQDTEEVKDQVKEMVKTKNLTFRQFMDTTQSVAEQFKVSGIPCTVLIDGKGIVQWIHTGGSPGLKKEIGEKLDKLVKGESLVKAETK
jgi:thiol-disulfide isomerase/thioredoxin